MFFLFEAFIQRPTETKSLVYFRGAIAILFTCGFLSYVAVLGVEVYKDRPLLQLFQNNLTDVRAPAVEICSQNSPIAIPHCDFTYRTWAPPTVYNNCAPWLHAEPVPANEYCYLFLLDDDSYFGNDASNLFAIDFYFQILNLTAAISQTVAVPALSVILFDNFYNPLNNDRSQWTDLDYQEWRDITNGKTTTCAIKGYTTVIRYTQTRYFGISNSDIGAVFGLTPNYEVVTSMNLQMENFPLHNSSRFSDTALSGTFSIGLAKAVEEIQREQRTHTVLSALALAGGAWGVLFAIYTILFGHPRLAPWGFVHQVSFSSVADKKHDEKLNNYDPISPAPEEFRSEQDKSLRLEARVQELESLLSNYFIDSGYLTKLKMRPGRSSRSA